MSKLRIFFSISVFRIFYAHSFFFTYRNVIIIIIQYVKMMIQSEFKEFTLIR